MSGPQDHPKRYDQCDESCTVDCGHCKGAGRPAAVPAEAGGAVKRAEDFAAATTDEERIAVLTRGLPGAEAVIRDEAAELIEWHDKYHRVGCSGCHIETVRGLGEQLREAQAEAEDYRQDFLAANGGAIKTAGEKWAAIAERDALRARLEAVEALCQEFYGDDYYDFREAILAALAGSPATEEPAASDG